jgi:hypothetical protein
MLAEITIPLEVLARLPPSVLRKLAEAAEIRERAPEQRERRPEQEEKLDDCVRALFVQRKLPGVPPADLQKQAEWRRLFVAAVTECHRRYTTGQYRAVAPGVAGAMVAVTQKGVARRRL